MKKLFLIIGSLIAIVGCATFNQVTDSNAEDGFKIYLISDEEAINYFDYENYTYAPPNEPSGLPKKIPGITLIFPDYEDPKWGELIKHAEFDKLLFSDEDIVSYGEDEWGRGLEMVLSKRTSRRIVETDQTDELFQIFKSLEVKPLETNTLQKRQSAKPRPPPVESPVHF